MESLSDYVKFIAYSMGVFELKDYQVDGITKWLINNEEYRNVLSDLEDQLKSAARFNGEWK